jgi:hypothetical protein
MSRSRTETPERCNLENQSGGGRKEWLGIKWKQRLTGYCHLQASASRLLGGVYAVND